MRQFAYDRLLYRVFTSDDRDRWVLKGATALLARLEGEARHSVDIDLFDQSGDLSKAEAALRAAAARDVGDHFRFVLAPGRRLAEEGVALRVGVRAFLGVTEFATFNVDLVTNTGMTGAPEETQPLVRVDIPGVPQTTYRIYPLADHIADKVFAIVERHTRAGGITIPSTRYRDLADLVVIATHETVDADALVAALRAQSERRRIPIPTELRPPDDPRWRAGFATVVRDVHAMEEKDFDAAVVVARGFINPVLDGTAKGEWVPEQQAWIAR
jgi:hypothetical protein